MKKLLWLIALAIPLLIISCRPSNHSVSSVAGLHFDSITVDTVIHLATSPHSPSSKLSLRICFAKGEKAGSFNQALIHSGLLLPDFFALSDEKLSMRQAIDSFIASYAREYKDFYGRLYRQDMAHAKAYNSGFSLTTSVEQHNERYVAYIARQTYYSSDTPPTPQTVALNYDLEQHKIVHLQDLLVPGARSSVDQIIGEALCKRFEAKDLQELEKKGILVGVPPYTPDNFIIGTDNINFIFCQNEIAPGNIGEITLSIDKEKLEKYIR